MQGEIDMSLNDLRNSKWVAIARLIFVILMLSACGGGGGDGSDPVDLPPPVNVYSYSEPVEKTDGWTTADAGALGMSVGLLEDMMNTLDTDFDIVDSIAISYRGWLVLDETVRTGTDEFDDRVAIRIRKCVSLLTDRYLPAVFSITENGTDYLYRVNCSPFW
jgi:hypothetical protein